MTYLIEYSKFFGVKSIFISLYELYFENFRPHKITVILIKNNNKYHTKMEVIKKKIERNLIINNEKKVIQY